MVGTFVHDRAQQAGPPASVRKACSPISRPVRWPLLATHLTGCGVGECWGRCRRRPATRYRWTACSCTRRKRSAAELDPLFSRRCPGPSASAPRRPAAAKVAGEPRTLPRPVGPPHRLVGVSSQSRCGPTPATCRRTGSMIAGQRCGERHVLVARVVQGDEIVGEAVCSSAPRSARRRRTVRRRRRPVRRHGLSHRRTPGSPHVATDPAGVELLGGVAPGQPRWRSSARPSRMREVTGGGGASSWRRRERAHRPAARTAHTATANRPASSRTAATNHTPPRVRRRVGAVGDHDAPSRSAGFQFDGCRRG